MKSLVLTSGFLATSLAFALQEGSEISQNADIPCTVTACSQPDGKGICEKETLVLGDPESDCWDFGPALDNKVSSIFVEEDCRVQLRDKSCDASLYDGVNLQTIVAPGIKNLYDFDYLNKASSVKVRVRQDRES